MLKNGLRKGTSHVVHRAYPIDHKTLQGLLEYLMRYGEEAWVYIVTLLLAFFTLARQSNLLSQYSTTLGPHTLLCSDLN